MVAEVSNLSGYLYNVTNKPPFSETGGFGGAVVGAAVVVVGAGVVVYGGRVGIGALVVVGAGVVVIGALVVVVGAGVVVIGALVVVGAGVVVTGTEVKNQSTNVSMYVGSALDGESVTNFQYTPFCFIYCNSLTASELLTTSFTPPRHLVVFIAVIYDGTLNVANEFVENRTLMMSPNVAISSLGVPVVPRQINIIGSRNRIWLTMA